MDDWKFVSDAMPEDGQKVYVAYLNQKNHWHILCCEFCGGNWKFKNPSRNPARIIAWKPVPPYPEPPDISMYRAREILENQKSHHATI